jgi:hypothetical protein
MHVILCTTSTHTDYGYLHSIWLDYATNTYVPCTNITGTYLVLILACQYEMSIIHKTLAVPRSRLLHYTYNVVHTYTTILST